MKLSIPGTAVIVVDVQAALFDPPPADAENVLARINGLTTRARQAGVPIVFVQHETAHDELRADSAGWQLHAALATAPTDLRLRKKRSDAFLQTGLHDLLAERDVQRLVVCGYASEFCVDSTVRGGSARGYAVTLVSDAHTTHDKPHATGAQIRTHENKTLRAITSFLAPIDTVPAAEIAFG